jgi:enoyl-CoA hydratase
MNTLNQEVMRELWEALNLFETDREVAVVVLTGAGRRAFCAGLELSALLEMGPIAAYHFARRGQSLVNRIEGFYKPTIAAVNGLALGAGMELFLVCDLALAADNAAFGFPEVRLGIIPSWGGVRRLSQIIGKRKAKELVFGGEILKAEQALAIGLVNDLVPLESLPQRVGELAEKIIRGGRIALWEAKKVMDRVSEMSAERALDYEAECFASCFSTAEPRTRIQDYLRRRLGEKRAPEETTPGERRETADVDSREGPRPTGEETGETTGEGEQGPEEDFFA